MLENLACSGAEQRLVDCPVDETDAEYTSAYNDYSYSGTPNQCEPFGQSYAFVACGSPPLPGGPCAPPSLLFSPIRRGPYVLFCSETNVLPLIQAVPAPTAICPAFCNTATAVSCPLFKQALAGVPKPRWYPHESYACAVPVQLHTGTCANVVPRPLYIASNCSCKRSGGSHHKSIHKYIICTSFDWPVEEDLLCIAQYDLGSCNALRLETLAAVVLRWQSCSAHS